MKWLSLFAAVVILGMPAGVNAEMFGLFGDPAVPVPMPQSEAAPQFVTGSYMGGCCGRTPSCCDNIWAGYCQSRGFRCHKACRSSKCGPTQKHCGPKQKHCAPIQKHCGPKQKHFGSIQKHCGPKQKHFAPVWKHCGFKTKHCGPVQKRCAPAQKHCAPRKHCAPVQKRCAPVQKHCGPKQKHCGPMQKGCGPSQKHFRSFRGCCPPFSGGCKSCKSHRCGWTPRYRGCCGVFGDQMHYGDAKVIDETTAPVEIPPAPDADEPVPAIPPQPTEATPAVNAPSREA